MTSLRLQFSSSSVSPWPAYLTNFRREGVKMPL